MNCPRRNGGENLTSVENTVNLIVEEHIQYFFPDNHIDEENEEKSVDNEIINEEDLNMDEIDIDDDVVNDDNIDIDNLHWQEIPICDPTLLETRNGTFNRSSSIPVFDETASGPNIRYIHRIHRTQKSKKSISAIDCLLCYFSTPIMSEFVNSTNSFGKLFLNKWKDTIMSEFMIFFAIILSLGIMRFPNRDIIWESVNFGSSWIRNLMTQRRFSDLLRAWHYEDYSKYTSNEIGELKKRGPFWSVKRISSLIANSFQNVFNCGQLLALRR